MQIKQLAHTLGISKIEAISTNETAEDRIGKVMGLVEGLG
jgi:hypothetical protein